MRNWLNCLWMWLNQVFVNDCTEILGIISLSVSVSVCLSFSLSLYLLWCFGLYSGHGLRCRGFTITLRHTILGRTPLDEWSSPPRDVCLTTHNTQDTDIHAPGIRTRNPSKRAAADSRLRPSGLWDRHCVTKCKRFLKRHAMRAVKSAWMNRLLSPWQVNRQPSSQSVSQSVSRSVR